MILYVIFKMAFLPLESDIVTEFVAPSGDISGINTRAGTGGGGW